MSINFNQNPYFDDFDETKNFHRLLFRPGYAVQARELTQIQTVLQNQIDKFGNHIFKNGSVVAGGNFSFINNAIYVKYIPSANPPSNLVGKIITKSGSQLKARVLHVEAASGNDSPTLYIEYITGSLNDSEPEQNLSFQQNDEIIVDVDNTPVGTVSNLADFTGYACLCSITEGVFFVNGFFSLIDASTIVLDKYTNDSSYRIGMQSDESIVDENVDSSLRDPALGSTNYQAPGSTRYKILLSLSKRSLTSTDDSSFYEIARVENGILINVFRYPQYSELENTLARRTYDESGNYTVRPFRITLKDHPTLSNSYNIVVAGGGKAYVFGYEFEKNGPTTLTAERARDTSNVVDYNLTTVYQNSLDITRLNGSIDFGSYGTDTYSMKPMTIHCVPASSIDLSTTDTANSTITGTLRVKYLRYAGGAVAANANASVWRAYVTDVETRSITANSTSGSANTIVLASSASSVDNAYNGVVLRIVTHAGTAVNEVQRIKSYVGSTRTATIESVFNFGTPSSATQYSLDFDIRDAESLVYDNGSATNVLITTSDINSTSKFSSGVDEYQGAFISGTDFNKMLFNFPNAYIVPNSVTNNEYLGKLFLTGKSFSANSLTIPISSEVSGAKFWTSGPSIETLDVLDSVFVVRKDTNRVINFADTGNNTVSITGGGDSITITANGTNSATADVYLKVDITNANLLRKTKTLYTANTKLLEVGGTTVSTGITWKKQTTSNGVQVIFNSSALTNLQTPNKPQNIHTTDAVSLLGVYDFGAFSADQANLNAGNYTDITSNYILDNGQRDNFYDHARITLKSNARGPVGNTAIFVSFFEDVTKTPGFYDVNSYSGIDYTQIPTYLSPITGEKTNLRDCLDFRPKKQNGSSSNLIGGSIVPVPSGNFETDFAYYLSRTDKLVLTKDRNFELVKGAPSLQPVAPAEKENAMTLYSFTLPPYTANTKDIVVNYVDNKRYTMRDIGVLEKRINNLEYYTSLSLLEQAAKDSQIIDPETGLERFKNGILVDPFTGHKIGDVLNPDYYISIDPTNQELRPPFNIENLDLDQYATVSGISRKGPVVSLSYTEDNLIENRIASKRVNLNPYDIANYLGTVTLDPTSDNWVDTTRRPDVLVNLEGDRDAWAALARAAENASSVFGTEWNDWQTIWTGQSSTTQNFRTFGRDWRFIGTVASPDQVGFTDVQRTTTTITQQQARTGVTTTFAPETITQSLGNRVVDLSIIPFIRSKNVIFEGAGFKPSTVVWPYFDGVAVKPYTDVINVVHVDTATPNFRDELSNRERVEIYEPNTASVIATADVVRVLNGKVLIQNVASVTGNAVVFSTANATYLRSNTNPTGANANVKILAYEHNSGRTVTATTNSITLAHDALGANNLSSLSGQKVYITSGKGLGQERTIDSYNSGTRVLTLTSNFNVTPDNTSTYSIGSHVSDSNGDVYGVFRIPNTDTVNFRTGERLFRLMDTSTGDLSIATTSGDAKYLAQGLLQTQEDTILSTTVPTIRRQTVNDERVINNVVVRDQVTVVPARPVLQQFFGGGGGGGGGGDPLAQTFTVNQNLHPEGVMITSLRLVFASKDSVIPVIVQIRPTVNGYPHSSYVVPYGEAILKPQDVKVVPETTMIERFSNSTLTHPLDDSNLYTQVNFKTPVYLQPGQEYAIVMITSTSAYETYVSTLGKNVLGTNRLISQQPLYGSFFESQNGGTWTAEQNDDLMFRLYKAKFTPGSAAVEFNIKTAPGTTIPVDTFYVTSQTLILPKTNITAAYKFSGESYTTFEMDDNVFFDDNRGRRNVTTDRNSFMLRTSLVTQSEDVSPLIDTTRLSLFAIENIIDNMSLADDDIVIVNSNSSYPNTNPSSVNVTITGGNGTGATANVTLTAFGSGNTVSKINVINGGSGYTETPTITLTSAAGSTTAVVIGENDPFGGPGLAKYITRKITLADNLDAGDLRVYFDAYKPSNANIYVYYKLLSADDPDTFDNKGYKLMTVIDGVNSVSSGINDYRTYTYAPGINNIADNSVLYQNTVLNTTHTEFKHFAIKVILASTDTTKVPRIRNFRVVAVPSS